MVVETLEKCHDTRVYDVAVLFSSKDERTLEPKRISSAFPNDQHCDGKYKLKIFRSRKGQVNLEIMFFNSKCTSPSMQHHCNIALSLRVNSKIVLKDQFLNLKLKCHTWRHLTSVNGRLSDKFDFSIKINSPIEARAMTFECLDRDALKDFTIQGSNGFSKKVHKSVLLYSSPVFRRLLKKAKKNCINLKADSVTISELIDYMYFGKQPQSNLTQLLRLARQFGMNDLANKCISELFDSVNVYNALNMLNFAVANDCPSLVFGIVYFIKLHSEEVVNENVRTMTNGETVKNDILNSFIKDYVDNASDILAIKKELFPNDV